MRLPQDRILHIDTEIVDGKMNVTAEWQGELVRCKDCRYHGMSDCPMWEGSITEDYMWCSYGERRK